METIGQLTKVEPSIDPDYSGKFEVDDFHSVTLEHAQAMTGLSVEDLRKQIGKQVTLVTDKTNTVIAVRFE